MCPTNIEIRDISVQTFMSAMKHHTTLRKLAKTFSPDFPVDHLRMAYILTSQVICRVTLSLAQSDAIDGFRSSEGSVKKRGGFI